MHLLCCVAKLKVWVDSCVPRQQLQQGSKMAEKEGTAELYLLRREKVERAPLQIIVYVWQGS
jgi:hypothetical protein